MQIDMFPDERFKSIVTIEELTNRKNEIFEYVLKNFPTLRYRQNEIHQKVDLNSAPWFVMEINSQRSLKREMPDFNEERIDTWPHVVIIFNNRPDIQMIAVSKNTRAFNSGSTVIKILQDNLAPVLQVYQLSIDIGARFEEKEFWNLVDEHREKIVSVNFELISPNMANISKNLKLDLKQIAVDTNSHRTDVKLNSSEGGILNLNQDNSIVNSLVDYSSKGGGTIKLKIKGYKRTLSTSKHVKKISMEEISFENISPTTLENIFGSLI